MVHLHKHIEETFPFTPGAFFHGHFDAAIGTSPAQGTSFAYAPGIGFAITPQLDAELKYMGISNSGAH